ncbi:MAG: beta-lactamase family protein [Desulfobacteraceae bacterium]|nr:beta-lactamase family protein [Desulfobacteraceae bacterium]
MSRKVCILLVVVLLLGAAAFWYLSRTLPIGTGHTAKIICSNVFIAGRDAATVYKEDIAPIHFLFSLTDYEVHPDKKEVVSTALGISRARAVYRDGCGCTLVTGITEEELRAQDFMRINRPGKGLYRDKDKPWPEGSAGARKELPGGVDSGLLQKAMDNAFAETDPEFRKNTRAVVAVYDGDLIAERYAPGISPQTPLLGWSMSKSVTNALVGILVRQGKLDPGDSGLTEKWRSRDDPRSEITLDNLMRMTSGLEFDEAYAPFSDAVEMFYESYDFAEYAADKPLKAPPGTEWSYSSGTANIVAKLVRKEASRDYDRYYRFLYEELFDRIGMHSAVFEPDPSGTFVGSSYMFASARDWARFGQLYLRDGIWEQERILPEGWVSYTTEPAKKAPQGKYGAMFWLNAGSSGDPGNRVWPSVPADAYCAKGFQDQRVIIIPSKKLVLVRLGNCTGEDAWNNEAFINDFLAALP